VLDLADEEGDRRDEQHDRGAQQRCPVAGDRQRQPEDQRAENGAQMMTA
jgi:hypothetical protein